MYAVPFNRSSLVGGEQQYIAEAMAIGQITGDQTYSKECRALLQDVLEVPTALVTASCIHALDMAVLLADVQPGDEAIVPSCTFVSTANPFALRGARIVFADIRPETLDLDENQLEALLQLVGQHERVQKFIPVS